MNSALKPGDESKPEISVVIASGAGGEFLFCCLETLRDQVQRMEVEVIVVDRCGEDNVRRLKREHPYMKVIGENSRENPSVLELRKAGVLAANGRIVAIIEEHCLAGPDWIAQILAEFEDADAAIGGPILANNYTRIQDWVMYFCEFHNYLPPWVSSDRYLLNGENIAYRRDILLDLHQVLADGYWEVVVHPLLAEKGRFRAVPEMAVCRAGTLGYGYYLNQRYLLSRVWGGTQRAHVNSLRRLFYLVAAPVLPFLLLLRIAFRVWQSKLYVREFILALPLLVPGVIAYVWGEWLGYLIGAGDALERVE